MKGIKKILAVMVAMVMTLGLAATNVFAASPFDPADTVDVTISGIKDGDQVTFYKLGTPSVDTNNQMTITWVDDAVKNLVENASDEGFNYEPTSELQAGIAGLIANETIKLADLDKTVSGVATDTTVTTALAPGYYLALVRQGAASGEDGDKIIYQNMLVNAVPQADSQTGTWKVHDDVTATVKKATETLTKTQFNGTDYTMETVDGYKFGDYVPFKIVTNIPSYPSNSKVATFVITDTPAGLRIVKDSTHPVTVKIAGVEVSENTNTFTVTVVDGKLTIEFTKAYILANPNAAVEVTYSAELLGNDNEIAVDTTNNTAKIKYNNNPDEETYQEPETTVEQKTYNFTLLKYEDGDSAKSPLVGASFSLWTSGTEGSKVALIADHTADGKEVYRPIKDGETADEYIVATDGTATVIGLDAGTYYIQEDIAPAGYTRLDGRMNVTVSATTSVAGIDVEIPNTPGTELPETGGIGTTIFYAIGSILVVGAGVLLISKKRMFN